MLVKLDVIKRIVCAKAQKVNKMWDNLLNTLIDGHASKPAPERDGEESDFIDVLLSLQEEYNLTRDHIKAQLVVYNDVTSPTTTTYMYIKIYTYSYIYVSICM